MKSIVLGAAGFLGRELCNYLQNNGHTVIRYDNFSSWDEAGVHGYMVECHDISSPIPVQDADVVFNLACPTIPQHYQADPEATIRACTEGVSNAIALAEKTGAMLVQASTVRVLTEHDHLNKHACYVEGKRIAETLCYLAYQRYPHIRIARLYSTFGSGMGLMDARVIPTFIRAALANQSLRVYGDGKQLDTFCHSSSVIRDLAKMAVQPDALVPDPPGSPVTLSIRDLADRVIRLAKSQSPIEFISTAEVPPDRHGGRWHYEGIESVDSGLAEMIETFRGRLNRVNA